jgi:L-lactate dehydrogenase
MMLRALFEEIVLIDADDALARAEAADLSDANALARPARVWAGTYADAATARIAVVTAGAASRHQESRLALASRSAAIVVQCARSLADAGFDGILLVASNPVDLLAAVALRHAGLPAARVIGTGTLLDTSRLRQALAHRLDVAPGAIHGFVLGEHGDSEVAAFSSLRIGGQPLESFAPEADLPAVAEEVRAAAYRIIEGKGFTSFGIATAIVRICEAIVRDERAILPVSARLSGEFGIDDLHLSMPCILGAGGIERVLLPDLDEREKAALKRSAEILRDALARLDSGG